MAADRFVTRKEIAFFLDVDERTITNWVKKHPEFPNRVRGRERDFPVLACIRWKRDKDVADAVASMGPQAPSDAKEAQKRLLIAQAELAESKVAKVKAEVMTVAQGTKEVRELFGRMRGAILSKVGEFADRMLHLETVAQSTPVLRELADELLSELQLRASAVSPDDEDDDDAAAAAEDPAL